MISWKAIKSFINMRRLPISLVALFALAALLGFGLTGCATSENEDSMSARPWNAPMGWENGLPAGMTPGRY
jgi:hypothetical protein